MDASVTAVHVRHGQSVRAGEPLLTLDSRELHEKQTTLLGRRAVLSERRTQWKQTLVKTGSTESTLGALDGRQIEEEIASIDSQIAIVQEIQSSLTLRAGRDGTVDAWRLNEVTVGRPMRRGDPLVRVVGDGAGWIVDARVPQRRTPLVREALDAGDFVAEASPDGNAGLKMIAQFDRFGPITTDSIDGTPAITLRCVLDDSKIDARNLVGDMPARVTIRCGKIPLGRFLMEDLWMTTQTWWTMIR